MARRKTATKAYGVFKVNLNRAGAFLRIFKKADSGGRGRGAPTADERELPRGCVVFAVGAFDAYLSDLILEIVLTFAPRSSSLNAALREMGKSDPGLSLRMTLAADSRAEFRTALDEWLETKSFQGPHKVANALAFLGCGLTLQDLDTVTGVDTAAELARITDHRHAIVHRGKKPDLSHGQADKAVSLVGAMAEAIDREVLKLYY